MYSIEEIRKLGPIVDSMMQVGENAYTEVLENRINTEKSDESILRSFLIRIGALGDKVKELCFTMPLELMPGLICEERVYARAIAEWRMLINK